jgi:hypothetical protein
MFSFNGVSRNGKGAAPVGELPTAKVGSKLGVIATRRSSRRVVRTRIEVLFKPFRPGIRNHALRKAEIRGLGAVRTLPHELEAELWRSRRYGRAFALVRIPCVATQSEGSNGIVELAYAVRSLIRFVDKAWTDGTSVYVLLPESDRAICQAMLTRIREPLAELLSEEDQAAITFAVFPDDGLTTRALFGALNGLTTDLAGRRDQIGSPPETSEAPVA